MKRGAVMVDVAIDQGGCFETSHATTHTDPVYIVDGRAALLAFRTCRRRSRNTSTFALNNATFPYYGSWRIAA